jgi:hypothetical protein
MLRVCMYVCVYVCVCVCDSQVRELLMEEANVQPVKTPVTVRHHYII